MKHQDKFIKGAFGTDDDANNLDTASRTACTRAYGHNDDGRHPERWAPRHIIKFLGREAGARRDAAHMEQCRAERLFKASGKRCNCAFRHRSKVEEEDEAHDSHGQITEIDAHLLVLEEHAAAADGHVVVEREVDAADNHEQTGHIFYIAATEEGHAFRMGAETAGRYCGERVTDGIVEVHRTKPIEERTSTGQHQVDKKHAASRCTYLRTQFI